MTTKDILSILEKNKDQRGIEHWKKISSGKMDSFGIGLTKLKTISKKFGKDHNLAEELWNINNYDAKIVSILIEDPKFVTEKQIDSRVKELSKGMFTHIFCTMLMSRLPFLKNKVDEWTKSKDNAIRRCGYTCLYVFAKSDDKTEDKYFESFLNIIEKNLQKEENFVKDAMNNSLLTIGMRNKYLNQKTIAVVKKIGKVVVDYGDNSCQAVDCLKHLTGERIQKNLNKK